MPRYTFKCDSCKESFTTFMTIELYRNGEPNGCALCSSKKIKRLFMPPSSKINRSKQEVVDNAKEEARDIARKIEMGDQKLIKDIYGEK